jgi:hypothetical protein
MSSTGVISKVGAPVTSGGESARQLEKAVAGDAGNTIHTVYGKIVKVDSGKPLIQVRNLQSGAMLAGSRFMPVNHSVREIAERWGKLKKGMKVLVQYTGPDQGDASAWIIKDADETLMEDSLEENTISMGLYKIFAPGIGIG